MGGVGDGEEEETTYEACPCYLRDVDWSECEYLLDGVDEEQD